jgi:SAM-dependent methyltransferase
MMVRMLFLWRLLRKGDFVRLRQLWWLKVNRLEYGYASHVDREDGNHHSISDPVYLRKVLRSLEIPAESVCLDLGAGMGIAAIVLSRFFTRVIGVELSGELIATAGRNLERMKVKNVELVHGDARAYKTLDEVTHVYLYNPFPEKVMRKVLENIEESVRRSPRKLTILYNCPVCYKEVEAAGYRREKVFMFRLAHPVAIYSSSTNLKEESTNYTN